MAKTFLKAAKMSETIGKCLLKENSKDKETRTIKAVLMSFLLLCADGFSLGQSAKICPRSDRDRVTLNIFKHYFISETGKHQSLKLGQALQTGKLGLLTIIS